MAVLSDHQIKEIGTTYNKSLREDLGLPPLDRSSAPPAAPAPEAERAAMSVGLGYTVHF